MGLELQNVWSTDGNRVTAQGLDNYGSEAIYSVGASVGLSESSNKYSADCSILHLRLGISALNGKCLVDGLK